MSINTKMTAIADRIRALLGLSGTMGLDAMATNLATEQTNVNNAFTAVNSKGGDVPSSKVSGNLATAINSIPTGVTVQRKSGTFTTDSSGNATVTCGFKPDLVVLHRSEGSSSKDIEFSCAAAFAEDKRKSMISLGLWGNTVIIYRTVVSRSDTGFSISDMMALNADGSQSTPETTFSYIAVKYTE